jgi:conjugal transfer ATP-binding protein TraC
VLDALKTLFHGERFEPADAVPRALLKQITALPRLTGILPYLGWMPEERLFVLDQGAFGGKTEQNLTFCIETVPQTGANEEMERVLASLFVSCPPGTGIQITLYASPHILPVLRRQANMLPVDAKTEGDTRERENERTGATTTSSGYLPVAASIITCVARSLPCSRTMSISCGITDA